MKSRDCPREKNIGGMSRGPSSGQPGCDKFLRKSYSKYRAEKLRREISDMEGGM